MFKETEKITILPKIWQMDPKKTMILFIIMDLLPNIFFGIYFILLSLLELYIVITARFNFTDLRYQKFCIIRLIFYFVTFIFIILLLIYRYKHDENVNNLVEILLFIIQIVFIVWNIFMTFNLKKSIENSSEMQGYLGADDLEGKISDLEKINSEEEKKEDEDNLNENLLIKENKED